MLRYFIAGNVWLFAALVIVLGREVVRTEPVRYAFYGIGGWFTAGGYAAIVVCCIVLGLGFLLAAARRSGRDA